MFCLSAGWRKTVEMSIDSVGRLWMNSKCKGNLNVDIQLILFPSQKENLTGDLAAQMLGESFEFLSKLTKKL